MWALSFLPQELPMLFTQCQEMLTVKTTFDHLFTLVPHMSYPKSLNRKG